MKKKLLTVIALVVIVTFAGMFLPRAEVSLGPFGTLPLSVGSGVAYASPAEKAFYFDAYNTGEAWKTNPENMTDGSESSYASTKTSAQVEALTGNTCTAASESGAITKVELRCYAYRDEGDDEIYLRPVFGGTTDGNNYQVTPGTSGGWSAYQDITSDTNAPSPWAWADVEGLDCDVEYLSGGPPNNNVYCSKVEIRVTYTNTPPTVGTITISPSSMTPQVEWMQITVPVTDNDTLADVNEVHVEVFYDSAGADPTAPGSAHFQTCAILTWTRGGAPWAIDQGTGTTWAINAAGCSAGSDALTTDDWVFSFKVGKVATHSPGTDDWDIYAKATDSVSQTGDNYLRDIEMNWYGEITVNTASVDWGSVVLGSGFTDDTTNRVEVSVSYICNGNYNKQIKTDDGEGNAWWEDNTETDTVALNADGTPGSGEFSLKADDDLTLAGAVLVSIAYNFNLGTGSQTGESGVTVDNNGIWLKTGPSGITSGVSYSGTIYYAIAQ